MKKTKATKSAGLSTGVTELNLAMTGRPDVGLLRGKYYPFVGKSGAGKTWLGKQCLAEAAKDPAFDGYRLINNNPEHGDLMDTARYYGRALAERQEVVCSRTIDGFYRHLTECLRAGPCVYLLDSEDALDPPPAKKGSEDKGSYGTEKAKYNSSHLRTAVNDLEESGGILIIIKQTRQNIGFDAMFNPETKSGGLAITFYATNELWFSVKGKIKRTALGRPRVIGSLLKVHVKKNRQVGRDRSVLVPFYPCHGMDDTGGLVDFLVREGRWKGSEKRVAAPEFEYEGGKEGLIQLIEQGGRVGELRVLACELWDEIEAACAVERVKRYE